MSAAGEPGLPLFHEGPGPFSGVFGGHDHAGALVLDPVGLVEGDPAGADDGLLGLGQGDRPAAGDLVGDLGCPVPDPVGLDQFGD